MEMEQYSHPGPLAPQVASLLKQIAAARIVERILQRDHTVWHDQPTEISNRLGWLDSPVEMPVVVPEIEQLVAAVRADGYTHALLLGMGGSSLAPEVLRLTFGVTPGFLDLAVLDSTDPAMVLQASRRLDPRRTLYIPATKSGGTVETLSFLKFFYGQAAAVLGAAEAGRHFVSITDPGSGLATLSAELGFRHTFLNNPDIGGRYSALSCFGMVPAALIGADITRLLQRAAEEAKDPGPATSLGALLAAGALHHRDKLTLLVTPELASFGAWVEQLIAESTGKDGKGILPVDREPELPPDAYGHDRIFYGVRLHEAGQTPAAPAALLAGEHPAGEQVLDDLYDLGALFLRWELATAIAGHSMSINPFDQPDVEAAKVLAREMVARYQESGELPAVEPTLVQNGITIVGGPAVESPESALDGFLAAAVPERGYICLQAYLPTTDAVDAALQDLRLALLRRAGVATTLGYGPRFLHSTGQLHKGDSGHGLFLQLAADQPEDADIPAAPGAEDSHITFGVLESAQAMGDRKALLHAGRRVLYIHLGTDIVAGLQRLQRAVVG
jgi:glucose-6-phosphate isomerase